MSEAKYKILKGYCESHKSCNGCIFFENSQCSFTHENVNECYSRYIAEGEGLDYWESITAIKNKQTEKGMKEYGQRLEDNDNLSIEDRIIMAEEEMIDALMYMEHLKRTLTGLTHENVEYVKERICDHYCKYPEKVTHDCYKGIAELEDVCCECPLNNL